MKDEFLQCYDELGVPSEVQSRSKVKAHPEKYVCGVANIWLVNDQGQLLVSKRSPNVSGNPNQWQTYLGGHVSAGMSFRQTAVKELEEEIGLRIKEEDLYLVAKGKDEKHHRFFESYALRFNGSVDELTFPDGEITHAKWMNIGAYQIEQKANYDKRLDNFVYNSGAQRR